MFKLSILSMTKLAHISDLHFSKITINPRFLLSKRFIGIGNLILNRKKSYNTQKLKTIPSFFKEKKVNFVAITGDLTSTSMHVEFKKAKNFINQFNKNEIKTLIVPGNHDVYTKKSHKEKRFYDFFKTITLKTHGIESHSIDDNWHYIGLDSCIPTSLFACSGLFSENIEKNLIKELDILPKDKNILIINHFPILHKTSDRKILKRREALKNILKKYPNIKLYLHGHTHLHNIIEKKEDLPLMVCSGCVSHKNASFNILNLTKHTVSIEKYTYNNKWKKEQSYEFVV